MKIHPELRALRSDDSPQRDAQTALFRAVDAWLCQPEVAQVRDQIAAFAEGRPIAEFPALASLFEAGSPAALQLAGGFASKVAMALTATPLGHVPLRHFTDGDSSTLLLMRSSNTTLSLVTVDSVAIIGKPEPLSVSYGPNETWEYVLAGQASVELVEYRPSGPLAAELQRQSIILRPGSVHNRDGSRVTRLLRSVDGCFTTLRLQRRRTNAGPAREYEVASGRMIHQAAGNPRDSRIELMLALLGRMGRTDAAPLMAELAREEGSTALRRQALRECLALDTREGFAALCAIAQAPGDALAGPAGALRAQLLESYPQLEAIEPCPA